MRDSTPTEPTGIERIVASVGSVGSLVVHSLAFVGFFLLSIFGIISWELMLLVLTTLVSLEAIYLAIFIQITVNRHTLSLKEVEEDIDEIQEDVEELGEDLEEIQEDIEEISEDIDEIQEDVEELNEEEGAEPKKAAAKPKSKAKKPTKDETLEQLAGDIKRMLATLEDLKNSK
jgi:TolA-binding protein